MLLVPSIPPLVDQLSLETSPVFRFLAFGGFEVKIAQARFDVAVAEARDLKD